MTSLDELKRLARNHQKRVDQELDIPGIIQDSSDLPAGKVRVWRPDIRQTTIVNGTVRTPNLDVLMRYKRGNQLTIVGTNIPNAAQKFGSAIGSAEQPPIVGEASGTLWADRNLKPGLVRPWVEGGYGLFVYVEKITYRDKVIQGPVPVSSNVPGSANQRRLAVITWDVSAEDFVVVDGTATTTSAPFTLEDYVAIPLGATDRLRLGAVELVNGQTTVAEDNGFIQERDWLTLHEPTVTVAAEDVTYDNGISGLTATDVQAAIDEIKGLIGGGGGGSVSLLLDYTNNSVGINGTTVTVTNTLDIFANQSFTVASGGSGIVEFSMRGVVLANSSGSQVGTRLVIDSAGTPINVPLGGGTPTSNFPNVLAGSAPVKISGLSVGSHTVKLQVLNAAGASIAVYCRSLASEAEYVGLQVTQLP